MASVLNIWDILTLCLYFVFVIGIGIYSMFRTNRGTLSGYFLAGRYMTWLPVGASLFASNIGSEHFIGLAGAGAASGIAVGAFEMNAGVVLQVLGWVYLPVYIASKVSTLPEYMNKRFGGQRIRILLSVLSLLLYIFTKVSVNLFAGSLFIRQILHWDFYLSILLLLALTALSTITGGLAAVIYTDTLQCFIMVCGGLILMIKGFWEVGGLTELIIKYSKSVSSFTLANSTCGQPHRDAWEMLRSPTSQDMPWPGFWFGQITAALWYWCSDQMMVQRALASKSLSHAQGGTIFTGYLKFLPLFMIVIPGMISRVLYPDIIACADPDECFKHCGSRVSCSNLAYPLLVLRLLPSGLRGILVAVILAALMSDLTSVFNSASTLVTMDIWQRIRKSAQTKELLIVGKVTVIVMVGLSIAWVPVILSMQGGKLFDYIQAVSSNLSPPIAAVYLMAVFWKRFNEQGAFWSLIVGFVIGIIRMGLDFYYISPACGEVDTRPSVIADVHYMYFALILFWCTVLTGVIVSLSTKPLKDYMLIRTMYWTRFDTELRPDEKISENKEIQNKSDFALHTIEAISPNKSTEILTADESTIPKWKMIAFWICGYNPENKQEANNEAMDAHLEKLSLLKQSSRVKVFLMCNLVIILVVTLALNLLFTYGSRLLVDSLL